MKKEITSAAAAVAVVSGALFAQDAITYDLSEMKGSPVAMVAEPITNKLFLFPYSATNAVISRAVLSVDGVVKQLREQGDMTNLVKKLVESGDVCAVIGHRWEPGCGNPVCAVYHADPIRHCALCGKTQTQTPEEWK